MRIRRVLTTAVAIALLAAGCVVVPNYTATSSTFEGFPVISHVPQNPRGIVYVFHGTGGSANFATKLETVDMLNRLTERGYGFVSTSSTDRSSKQWDTGSLSLTANPDLARLARLHANVVANTPITNATPIFAVGMSRGAGFTPVFAQGFKNAGYPVKATGPSHGQIPIAVRASLTVPGFWALGANDSVVDNARTVDQVGDLQRRGVAAEVVIEPEVALSAARFLRVPGIEQAEADDTFTRLVNAGLWNGAGQRIASIATIQSRFPTLALTASITSAQRDDIADQIAVVLAEHQYSATYATRTADFFDAHR